MVNKGTSSVGSTLLNLLGRDICRRQSREKFYQNCQSPWYWEDQIEGTHQYSGEISTSTLKNWPRHAKSVKNSNLGICGNRKFRPRYNKGLSTQWELMCSTWATMSTWISSLFLKRYPDSRAQSKVVDDLTKQIFIGQGISRTVRSDNGPHFHGYYRQFAKEYRLSHITSSLICPKKHYYDLHTKASPKPRTRSEDSSWEPDDPGVEASGDTRQDPGNSEILFSLHTKRQIVAAQSVADL